MAIVGGRLPGWVGLAVAVLTALMLLSLTSPARAQASGVGAGIFSVDGNSLEDVTLPIGGTYYLTVATDDSSSYVDAQVLYNGTTVLAQANRSLGFSTLVSLPAGNY